jgi:hypothetical protein
LPKKLDPLEPLDGFSLLAMLEDVWVAEVGLEAAVAVFVAVAAVAFGGAVVDGPAEGIGLSAFNLKVSFILTFTYGFDPEFFSRP